MAWAHLRNMTIVGVNTTSSFHFTQLSRCVECMGLYHTWERNDCSPVTVQKNLKTLFSHKELRKVKVENKLVWLMQNSVLQKPSRRAELALRRLMDRKTIMPMVFWLVWAFRTLVWCENMCVQHTLLDELKEHVGAVAMDINSIASLLPGLKLGKYQDVHLHLKRSLSQ